MKVLANEKVAYYVRTFSEMTAKVLYSINCLRNTGTSPNSVVKCTLPASCVKKVGNECGVQLYATNETQS